MAGSTDKENRLKNLACFALLAAALLPRAAAQGTLTDYQRANGLRDRFENLTVNVPEAPQWLPDSHRLIYRNTILGGHEFVLVDADSAPVSKQPAFDHARLAASLSKASGIPYTAAKLPFRRITYADQGKAVDYTVGDSLWKTDLANYNTVRVGPYRASGNGVGRPPRPPVSEMFDKPVASPDGRREALIRNYNLWVRQKGAKEAIPLSMDGSEGDYYDLKSIVWSPDSRRIAV